MSDLPESLRRAHRAATSRVQSGPQNAIRATSPASPYARDRIEAPSNRPAPRAPTLRSRTQDVIRAAPGALTAARERFNYDLPPVVSQGARDAINSLPDTNWGRVGQELTGLPSLARGAGGLTGLALRGMDGGFEGADFGRGAGATAETALGLLGPMSLPRGAARASAIANVAEEPAARIARPAREIGPNGMPVAQSQPTRNSFRGGSSDLREAAGMGAVQRLDDPQGRGFITYREGPDGWQVRQSRVLGEHRGQGVGTQLYSDLIERARAAGAPRITSDVTVSEDAARVYDSLQRRGYPVRRSERFEPGALHSRPPFSIDLTRPRTPPPTTPTGTAPFGDPRAYPPQAWEEFGSLQGGAPEARAPRRTLDFRTPRGEMHPTIVNPTESDMLRLATPPRELPAGSATERGVAHSAFNRLRYLRHGDNLYVGNAYNVTHHDLVTAHGLPNRGFMEGGEIHRLPDGSLQVQSDTGYVGSVPGDWLGRAARSPEPLRGGTPEARLRAQEQGFDTGRVLYHGTDKDFPAFDVGQAGTGANAGLREEAVFLTDSPAVADSYLSGGYVRSENARGASADMGDGVARWYGDGAQVMPVHVRNGGDMDYWDWGGGGYSPEQIERALREAREAGRPGVVFRGIRDPGIQNTVGPVGNPRRPSNMVAVFDPSNIRSIFAAFDPAKRDSSDLLAASAAATPIPIAAHALTQQQNTTGRPRGRPGFFGGR